MILPAVTAYASAWSCDQMLMIVTGRMVSKAPLTSRVRREAVRPLLRASLTLWVRQVVKSTAEQRGRAPNC